MKRHFFTFNTDARGFGQLQLHNDSLIVTEKYCRTGSLKKVFTGVKLVNAIPDGLWVIKHPPVDTTEEGMYIIGGNGWKGRLYKVEKDGSETWTHYLIHPDGRKGGSLGCVVTINTDALDLRERIEQVLQKQEKIYVYINIPFPEDKGENMGKIDEFKKAVEKMTGKNVSNEVVGLLSDKAKEVVIYDPKINKQKGKKAGADNAVTVFVSLGLFGLLKKIINLPADLENWLFGGISLGVGYVFAYIRKRFTNQKKMTKGQ